jgi:hypothetical protein
MQRPASTRASCGCGLHRHRAEGEHRIVRQAKGSTHHPTNILPTCTRCNSSKRDR